MERFKQYWASLSKEDRQLIADEAETSVEYLYQCSTGFRKASPDLAKRIRKATGKKLRLKDIRPDVYGDLYA